MWQRAITAVGREPESSQGFVTAAAPTYLPNDRAFGMKRTRNCDTCFSWYSYIYMYIHTERRVSFHLLFYLPWWTWTGLSVGYSVVYRVWFDAAVARRDKCTRRTGSLREVEDEGGQVEETWPGNSPCFVPE